MKRLIWENRFLLLEQAIHVVFGVVLAVGLARNFGPETLGASAIGGTYAAIVALIANYSFDLALVRRHAVNPGGYGADLGAMLAFRVISYFLLSCVGSALFWDRPIEILFFLFGVLVAAINGCNLYALGLFVRGESRFGAGHRLVLNGTFFLVKAVCLFDGQLIAYLVAGFTEAILSLWVYKRIFTSNDLVIPPLLVSVPHLIGLLRESSGLFASALIVGMFFKMDVLALSIWSTTKETGIYATGLRVMEAYAAVGSTVLAQGAKRMAEASSDRAALLRVSSLLIGTALVLGLGTIVFHVVIGRAAISLIFGDIYRPSSDIALLLCVGAVALHLGTVRAYYISFIGAHSAHVKAAALGFIVLFLTLAPMTIAFGAVGTAISMTLGIWVSAVFSSYMILAVREFVATYSPRAMFSS